MCIVQVCVCEYLSILSYVVYSMYTEQLWNCLKHKLQFCTPPPEQTSHFLFEDHFLLGPPKCLSLQYHHPLLSVTPDDR